MAPRSFWFVVSWKNPARPGRSGDGPQTPSPGHAPSSSQASPEPCRLDKGIRAGQGEVHPGSYPTGPQILIIYNGGSNILFRASVQRESVTTSLQEIADLIPQSGSLKQLLVSHSVVSNSLRPHGPQHARLPCLSLSPGGCSNSQPVSQ